MTDDLGITGDFLWYVFSGKLKRVAITSIWYVPHSTDTLRGTEQGKEDRFEVSLLSYEQNSLIVGLCRTWWG